MFSRKYEISVWEDYQIHLYNRKKDGVEEEFIVEDVVHWKPDPAEGYEYTPIRQWYDERCISVIGSDSMTVEGRACNPKLTKRINGEYELTFDLYRQYFDKDELEFIENPFIGFLVNERKIKVHLISEDKWFDFVIKNINEDSEQKKFTYTARALFINELSKTGFELVFDTELENNTGTIQELGKKVVEGTDWFIDEKNSELIQQFIIEPLYKLQLKVARPITLEKMFAGEDDEDKSIELERKTEEDIIYLYAFYSDIVNQNSTLQVVYNQNNVYTIDTDTQAINNSPNWLIKNVTYTGENYLPSFAIDYLEVSSEYRGKKFVRNAETEYDPILKQTVDVYTDTNGRKIRRYTETQYLEPTLVETLVTNPTDFVNITGWFSENDEKIFSVGNYPVVERKDGESNSDFLQALEKTSPCLQFKLKQGEKILNTGLYDRRDVFSSGGIAENEKFVLRIKYKTDVTNTTPAPQLKCFVQQYKIDSKGNLTLIGRNSILDFGVLEYYGYDDNNKTWIENWSNDSLIITSAKTALSYQDMFTNRLGIIFEATSDATFIIEHIDLFKYYEHTVTKKDEQDNDILVDEIIQPGIAPTNENLIQTIYHYYDKDANKDKKSADEWVYLYQGTDEQSDYFPVFDEQCTKKRAIKASKSNRFNIIQNLCETFECWADFHIEHDSNGRVARYAEEDFGEGGLPISEREARLGKQKKTIIFKNYITKDNYAGFKYGINTKSIQRTVDSEQLVTKIIVEENNNEFATDGFCSISRAIDNPTGELFFYDFRHYYNQGLLSYAELMNDLYLYTPNTSWLGYYKRMKEVNQQRESLVNELASLNLSHTKVEANVTTYKALMEESATQLQNKKQEFANYAPSHGLTYEEYKDGKYPSNLNTAELQKGYDNDPEIQKIVAAIQTLTKQYTTAEQNYKAYEESWNNLGNQIDFIEGNEDDVFEEKVTLASIKNKKEELNKLFYEKYSRFIQEGSWASEDYIDDNLYYYDAAAALSISASPQISYTINIIDVSTLPEYENYKFDTGDKTYVEDTEFFGWVMIDGIKTPVQEEVVVSEITLSLDNPDEDVITVQNYKTKFEDLFQRISATTAELKFQSGSFAKAAAIITPTGEIDAQTLQNSFNQNAFRLANSGTQTVVWDENGITVTSPSSPNQIVRIINGGIYLTENSGSTWSAAVTGAGINANYINVGQLDTSLIRIMNGTQPTYRWDGDGLSAFRYSLGSDGDIQTINHNQYVRFDQYGIYGVNADEYWVAENLGAVKKQADFALTWDGFLLRSKHDKGFVEISSENDIIVHDGSTREVDGVEVLAEPRIKIGKIGVLETALPDGTSTKTPIYGLSIKNKAGMEVLETNDQGELWLKDKLQIGSSPEDMKVAIGNLGMDSDKLLRRVIDANNNFIVYEDGSMVAENGTFKGKLEGAGGTFTGTLNGVDGTFTGKLEAASGSFKGEITATGGQIGNLTIESFEQLPYKIEIISETGTIFKNNSGASKTLECKILYNNKEWSSEDYEVTYQWYKNGEVISNATSKTLTVSPKDVPDRGTAAYLCDVKIKQKTTIQDQTSA